MELTWFNDNVVFRSIHLELHCDSFNTDSGPAQVSCMFKYKIISRMDKLRHQKINIMYEVFIQDLLFAFLPI